MSIADHFDNSPDAGFIRDYDSDSARRQFRVSLVLIMVIAFAAAALGILIRFDGPSPSTTDATMASSQSVPAYAGKL